MTTWNSQPIRRGYRAPLTEREMQRAFEMTRRHRPLDKHRRIGDVAAFPPIVALERQPFRWDTNGFYRRLGLETTASRLDIVRAFLELDPRQDFYRLAFAAEVLLSKTKRPRYDALSIGTFWAGDPDLGEARGLERLKVDTWGIYADGTITDEQALTVSAIWRSMLAMALAPLLADVDPLPFVGIGVTAAKADSRWEQVGHFAILFVPLDEEPSLEYVHTAAQKLMQIATPMRA
jgi:hypothetical protein